MCKSLLCTQPPKSKGYSNFSPHGRVLWSPVSTRTNPVNLDIHPVSHPPSTTPIITPLNNSPVLRFLKYKNHTTMATDLVMPRMADPAQTHNYYSPQQQQPSHATTSTRSPIYPGNEGKTETITYRKIYFEVAVCLAYYWGFSSLSFKASRFGG